MAHNNKRNKAVNSSLTSSNNGDEKEGNAEVSTSLPMFNVVLVISGEHQLFN